MYRNIRIAKGKGKVILILEIESRSVCEPINLSVFRSDSLIDLPTVNHVLVKLSRGPGKHKDIVALAHLDLSLWPRMDSFDWQDAYGYRASVLLPPFFGPHADTSPTAVAN